MKYGEKLVEQSVPKWSLYNVDYNSLKHEIKVHTSRDQAKAMAIPGHESTALSRFEQRLYLELCGQHERVDLFVMTKSDEIMRKLEHLADLIQNLVMRCNQDSAMTTRRQRKFIRYERELLHCGDDIAALQRFVDAQVVAFRKILKKYKKWTGSASLGTRFRENVLRHPKSFTRRDFDHLQARFSEILNGLHDAAPTDADDSSSPVHISRQASTCTHLLGDSYDDGAPGPGHGHGHGPVDQAPRCLRYWNEYDDGSECGANDEYVIYVNPDDDDDDGFTLPGFVYLSAILKTPFKTAQSWFSRRHHHHHGDPERQSLLPTSAGGSATDSEEWSADESPAIASRPSCAPYGTIYFSPHHHQPRLFHDNRDRLLVCITLGSFAAALTLLVVEAMMLGTGRTEVDAAIAVAAVASLLFASGGLWAGVWLRGEHDQSPRAISPEAKMVAWATFVANFLLNMLILVVVVSSLGVYCGFWGANAATP